MPAEIEPPELARLVDFSECPRAEDWSLRAALVRYAQPEPERVDALLDLVRRTEWALGKQASYIAAHGTELWDALNGGDATGLDVDLVGVLDVARALDRVGDSLAVWAVDRSGAKPDAEVDATIADLRERLRALGVPEQERPPGPRNRG